MKVTVYCDKEGILRYNPDGWPKEPSKPGEWAHQEFFTEYYEYKAKLRKDIEKAKSESIPFEDQRIIKNALMHPFNVIHFDNLVVLDTFYDVEIDGVIEIADQICQYKGENECYTRKVARIIPMYKQLSHKEQEYKEMIDTIKLLSTEEGVEYLKKILS